MVSSGMKNGGRETSLCNVRYRYPSSGSVRVQQEGFATRIGILVLAAAASQATSSGCLNATHATDEERLSPPKWHFCRLLSPHAHPSLHPNPPGLTNSPLDHDISRGRRVRGLPPASEGQVSGQILNGLVWFLIGKKRAGGSETQLSSQ